MLITSDLGGADPAAEVEAWIRVCAPADADDAQGGPPSDASVEHGLLQEGQEGSVDADPVYERVDEPAVDRQVLDIDNNDINDMRHYFSGWLCPMLLPTHFQWQNLRLN